MTSSSAPLQRLLARLDITIDFLVGDWKRAGITPDTGVTTARQKTSLQQSHHLPTGQACTATATAKLSRAIHTISQHGREHERTGIGQPHNVVRDLVVNHAGKIVRDIRRHAFCATDTRTGTVPVDDTTAFYGYLHTLFPGWKPGVPGFAVGDRDMVETFGNALLVLFSEPRSSAPTALAIAMAQRLADVTNGDIRHARAVLAYLDTAGAEMLNRLFVPAQPGAPAPLPADLRRILAHDNVIRTGDAPLRHVRLEAEDLQARALRVALSLSRHPHDFRALRKLLHRGLDVTPAAARLLTKPAPHWLDPSDTGCADQLLLHALQAADLMQTPALPEEDRAYAEDCLGMLCQLWQYARTDPAQIARYRQGLTARQRGNLYAWHQGFRSVADIAAAGRRIRKVSIWMQRNEAIKKRKVLKFAPAPLRALFWGKAPFRAMRMGDGGASMKHPDEMQEKYDNMLSTLSRHLYQQLSRETTLAYQHQDPGEVIEKLLWRQAHETFANMSFADAAPATRIGMRDVSQLTESETEQLCIAFQHKCDAAGIGDEARRDYLRRAGHTLDNGETTIAALCTHFLPRLDRRTLERAFRQWHLMHEVPVPQVLTGEPPPVTPPEIAAQGNVDMSQAQRLFQDDETEVLPPWPDEPIDTAYLQDRQPGPMGLIVLRNDEILPRPAPAPARRAAWPARLPTAHEIFKAMKCIETADLKPEDSSIRGIQQHLVRMVQQEQDNSWRTEEKVASGINGTIFAGLGTFHYVGARVTAIAGGAGYFGIESKNWGMELTFGRKVHRATGAEARYVAGSDTELEEHLRLSGVASFGYDSEYTDTEGIKILVRRDYGEHGDIEFQMTHDPQRVEALPMLGEDGQPVQSWRYESQCVVEFFGNAAQNRRYPHVETAGRTTLKDYDARSVFDSFANEFFDSKLISISQTHATTSSQKTSASVGMLARGAFERNSRKFQVGGSAMLAQGAYTATKGTTFDRNGQQALDMVYYNHAYDVRSALGLSSVVVPGFNQDSMPGMTANAIAAGVTSTYRARESRAQISLLKKNGLIDSVFSYFGQNFKRPKDFRAAIASEQVAWENYFGGPEELEEAIQQVLAHATSQNIVLMVRYRLREHVGAQLDALNAQIAFHQSIRDDRRRSRQERDLAGLHIRSLRAATGQLLLRPDSREPFGLGAFSRVEKSRSRGINYYVHATSTQTISATQELVYKARKATERDEARHLKQQAYLDQRTYGRFMHKVERLLRLHPDAPLHNRKLERLRQGWQALLRLRQDILQEEVRARQARDPAAPRPEEDQTAPLRNMAAGLEGLLRYLDIIEDIRARKFAGKQAFMREVYNPSYRLLSAVLAHPQISGMAGDAGAYEQRVLQAVYDLNKMLAWNDTMVANAQRTSTPTSAEAHFARLTECWEQRCATTLAAQLNAPVDAFADELAARASQRREIRTNHEQLMRLNATSTADDDAIHRADATRDQEHAELKARTRATRHALRQRTAYIYRRTR